MRVIDAARELGVSAEWLRRLEREGRIPAARRDLNGYRRYTPEDIEYIQRALFGGERPVRQTTSDRGGQKRGNGGERGTYGAEVKPRETSTAG